MRWGLLTGLSNRTGGSCAMMNLVGMNLTNVHVYIHIFIYVDDYVIIQVDPFGSI